MLGPAKAVLPMAILVRVQPFCSDVSLRLSQGADAMWVISGAASALTVVAKGCIRDKPTEVSARV